jgi:hypothetical protein
MTSSSTAIQPAPRIATIRLYLDLNEQKELNNMVFLEKIKFFGQIQKKNIDELQLSYKK